MVQKRNVEKAKQELDVYLQKRADTKAKPSPMEEAIKVSL